VIDHHTLQVESPEKVADLARLALKYISAERLILCSDCGMGREGMGRRHAVYKMTSLVRGANIARGEVGAPEAECLAAAPNFSLIRTQLQSRSWVPLNAKVCVAQ
jgi:5-methyltetrahydropteroyltriglutamate--homocysteine methyltransferase